VEDKKKRRTNWISCGVVLGHQMFTDFRLSQNRRNIHTEAPRKSTRFYNSNQVNDLQLTSRRVETVRSGAGARMETDRSRVAHSIPSTRRGRVARAG
jgi:hypothetical protein